MDERMSESAAEVIAQHRKLWSDTVASCSGCDWSQFGNITRTDLAHASHVLDALRGAGWAVIAVPEVAHKGPHDTDAKFYRQVADRMENPKCRFDDLSGSNVRNAVRELLYRAAAAVSQDGEK